MVLAEDSLSLLTVLVSGVLAFVVAWATAKWQQRTEFSKFRQSHRVEALFKAADSLTAWWLLVQDDLDAAINLCGVHEDNKGSGEKARAMVRCDETSAILEKQGQSHLATAMGYMHLLGYRSAYEALGELIQRSHFVFTPIECARLEVGHVPGTEWVLAKAGSVSKQFLVVFDHLARALEDEYYQRRAPRASTAPE